MADYVLLNGVRTWYEERGEGDPLVLLHPGGAGADARRLDRASGRSPCTFACTRRSGVRTPDVEGPITFDAMAQDAIAFLETIVGRRAHIVGSSDDATVGLLVALKRPDLIDRLVWPTVLLLPDHVRRGQQDRRDRAAGRPTRYAAAISVRRQEARPRSRWRPGRLGAWPQRPARRLCPRRGPRGRCGGRPRGLPASRALLCSTGRRSRCSPDGRRPAQSPIQPCWPQRSPALGRPRPPHAQ